MSLLYVSFTGLFSHLYTHLWEETSFDPSIFVPTHLKKSHVKETYLIAIHEKGTAVACVGDQDVMAIRYAPQKRPVKETYKETNMWTYLIAIHENGTTVAGVGDHDVTACNGHDHACWPIQPPLVHYLCVCEREAEKERERERGRERERARARKGGGGRDDSVCVREWVCEWNICKYVYV